MHRPRPAVALLVALLLLGPATAAWAQARPEARQETAQADRGRTEERRLPAEVTTEHTLALPGRELRFTATLGSVPLYEGEGGPLIAEVAVTVFRKPGADPATRPVTFLVNGGPGAASAYLNIGAIGPWRLPLAAPLPSASPVTVPNPETWLDFTDLVFVDPPGAGWSWAAGRPEDQRRRFFAVDADISALAVVVRKWLDRENRRASPKYLVGESYGGFRVPRLARELQGSQGIGVSGIMMVSPVLDFGWRFQSRHTPLRFASELPSMAATALAARGSFDRNALRAAEDYASGEFVVDFLRGPSDQAAVARMSARVAALTGLDPDYVRRHGGRVDAGMFARETGRAGGRIASLYDATVTAPDPYPTATFARRDDPVLDGSEPPLTAAMTDLARRLGWTLDRPYRLLNKDVNRAWDWGSRRTAPQVVDDLREALALDPTLRAVVAHGATDLVTPYFENQMLVAQLPGFGDRLRLALYPGGHMFYFRDDARASFRADAEAMMAAP